MPSGRATSACLSVALPGLDGTVSVSRWMLATLHGVLSSVWPGSPGVGSYVPTPAWQAVSARATVYLSSTITKYGALARVATIRWPVVA